jgi:hypothetical protein
VGRVRLWAVVFVGYVGARIVVRIAVLHVLRIDAAFAAELLVVPVAQIAVLEALARTIWPRLWMDSQR